MLGVKPFSEYRFRHEQTQYKETGEKNNGKKDNFRLRKAHAGLFSEILFVTDNKLIPRGEPVG